MTRVKAKIPECNYLSTMQPETKAMWLRWVGKFITIDAVEDPLPDAPCDTDKAFEVIEPAFKEEYSQIDGCPNYIRIYICRHMIEAGD